MEATNIRVQPKEVPTAELETACVIINNAIRLLLSQADVAEEYQAWKDRRDKGNEKK